MMVASTGIVVMQAENSERKNDKASSDMAS
jgi:hypothetical protein